jgi:hypothetical protein
MMARDPAADALQDAVKGAEATASGRKARLWGCACAMSYWPLLPQRCRDALLLAGRYDDESYCRNPTISERMRGARSLVAAALSQSSTQRQVPVYYAARLVQFLLEPSVTLADVYACLRYREQASAATPDREARRWLVTPTTARLLLEDITAVPQSFRCQRCDGKGEFADGVKVPRVRPCPCCHLQGSILPDYRRLRSEHGRVALRLAEQFYDTQDPYLLAVAADALDDAGLQAPELVAHMRSGAAHARGCWAVDMLLLRR